MRAPEGRVRLWNRASEQLYGLSAADAVGQSFHELVASRHTFGIPALEEKLFVDDAWQGEIYRTAADGRELCIEVRWQVHRDPSGEVSEILEWGRDRSAEDAERREAAATVHRYRNLFHAMAASFWELDFSEVRRKVGALIAGGEKDLPGFLRANPDFVDECIAATIILDVNDTTVEMFGAPSREAILELPLGWEWPAESRHYYAAAVAAAAAGQERYVTELTLHRWDGSLMDALFTVCWPNEHKAQGSVLVGVIDISERKKMERELRESEARYRDLFAFMPVALCELDTSRQAERLASLKAMGVEDLPAYLAEHPELSAELQTLVTVTDANAEAIRLLEAADLEDIKGPISRFWSASPETLERALIARFGGKLHFSEETLGVTLRGNHIEVLFSVSFVPELDEKGVSVVSFIDIGERTRAVRALQSSERRYRDLFQQVPVALWSLEPGMLRDMLEEVRKSGVADLGPYFDSHPEFLRACMEAITILEVNSAAVALTGAESAEQLVGRTTADFWVGQTEVFRNSLVARFAGEPSFRQEGLINSPFRCDIPIDFSVSFPPIEDRRAVSVVSTLDISARKAAEQRLRRVEADFSHAARVSTLGELAASIAHEVNQPLAAITAFGQAGLRWLARPEPDMEELKSLTEQIVDDARRASAIIARIRKMAMKSEPVRQILFLNDVIEEALLIVGREATNLFVRITTSLAADLPPISGDRVQLQQVVVNLALNAVQAMSEQEGARKLDLFTKLLNENTIELLVEDNGPGIAPTDLDHLFDGFFTTKQHGMGMGLPICRTIIEAHGGYIRAENGDHGARFLIGLPVGLI